MFVGSWRAWPCRGFSILKQFYSCLLVGLSVFWFVVPSVGLLVSRSVCDVYIIILCYTHSYQNWEDGGLGDIFRILLDTLRLIMWTNLEYLRMQLGYFCDAFWILLGYFRFIFELLLGFAWNTFGILLKYFLDTFQIHL